MRAELQDAGCLGMASQCVGALEASECEIGHPRDFMVIPHIGAMDVTCHCLHSLLKETFRYLCLPGLSDLLNYIMPSI